MEKRKYGIWTQEQLQMDVDVSKTKKFGFNKCCRQFGIPKPTLKRHL